MNPTNDVDTTDPVAVLALFASIARRAAATAGVESRLVGGRDDAEAQYAIDVEIDRMCVDALHAAGLDVLSEESGITRPDGAGGPGLSIASSWSIHSTGRPMRRSV